jgi:hypothetical protein
MPCSYCGVDSNVGMGLIANVGRRNSKRKGVHAPASGAIIRCLNWLL